MEELLKLIKANMKEGADIAAIQKLAEGLNPLAGVKTVEEAKVLIAKTDLLRSANDSLVSIAVKSHDDKFTAEKLPELLKAEGEKIRKEINPKETDEQKKIREQGEEIQKLKDDGSKATLKTALTAQAAELGYKGNVNLFLGYEPKEAGKLLKADFDLFKTSVDERVSSDIKKLYGDIKPRTSTEIPPEDLDAQIMKARSEGNSDLALKLQMQKDTPKKE